MGEYELTKEKFLELIPDDSKLHDFITILNATEVPVSYAVATGLSTIGVVCRRSIFIDQVNWRVYPPLRLMLVGPTGVGKDTAIDRGIDALAYCGNIPIIGGKSFETIQQSLVSLRPPAVAMIPAKELTAFIGKSNYQESMVQRITDLLSDSARVDVSTKSEGELYIVEPTITMMAGSTPEWLQKAMPEGALEGGFFPRFLIVSEDYTGRQIPLVKHTLNSGEVKVVNEAKERFHEWLRKLNNVMRNRLQPSKRKEIILLSDAVDMYTNWYYNRKKYFSPTVRPYAERSRDQVLRLAMLLAISRERPWIDAQDMAFAIEYMQYIGARLDAAVIPVRKEAQCGQEILNILPMDLNNIRIKLISKYGRRMIQEALTFLKETNQMKVEDGICSKT